jgi:hypothetical protein
MDLLLFVGSRCAEPFSAAIRKSRHEELTYATAEFEALLPYWAIA